MKWMIRLYPAAWQQRYGEEFAEALGHQRASVGLMVDVLGGAVDAWFHPGLYKQGFYKQGFNEHEATQGEITMTIEMANDMNGGNGGNGANAMIKRCAAGGAKLTQREQIMAAIWTALTTLLLSAAYVALRKIYHGIPAVEALGYMAVPGMYLVYLQVAYLQRYSVRTRAAMITGILGALYLIFWTASAIAVRI